MKVDIALINRLLKIVWENFALLLFDPRACLLCQIENSSGNKLCPNCEIFFGSLEPIKTTLLGEDHKLNTLTCYSAGFYEGLLQEAIYQIKYLKQVELAAAMGPAMLPPTVALQIFRQTQAEQIGGKIAILPVPLHNTKKRERGFNQAEELAHQVCAIMKGQGQAVQVDTLSLKRVRMTVPQFGLSREERRKNLAGAFKANRKRLAGRPVLIVDDVLTSGATLYECALAATEAGAHVVGALTLGRARWLSTPSGHQINGATAVPTS